MIYNNGKGNLLLGGHFLIRLLIADDEFFVRNGLIRNIKWKELGVDEVEEADDGLNAYEKALEAKPDILVTDVRMPRMDGIELGSKIREVFPNCKIIFMSAYSDKEYLKSAIHLKAISYVEKPINPAEISRAIADAVSLRMEEEKRRASETVQERNLNDSLLILKDNLPLALIHSNLNLPLIKKWLDTAGIDMSFHGSYAVALIKLGLIKPDTLKESSLARPEIMYTIEDAFYSYRIKYLTGYKDSSTLVVIAYSNPSDSRHLSHTLLTEACARVLRDLKHKLDIFISTGIVVNKPNDICKSYQSAVLSGQQLFFKGYGSLSVPEDMSNPVFEFNDEIAGEFSIYLENGQKEELVKFVRDFTRNLRQSRNTLVCNIKNAYFKILLLLESTAAKQQINLGFKDSEGTLWETLSAFETLDAMEKFLIDLVASYFVQLAETDSNSRTISEIKRIISKNYSDPDLCIKAISEKMFLSHSYLCVFFKKETGTTINQYITDFRIKKARELLEDRNVRLCDVAAKVGYPDQNYFTKIFKKLVCVTPSEYRERCFR